MRRFLLKAIMFSIAPLLWMGFVVAVDPFDYFNISPFVDSALKRDTSSSLNSLLYNSIRFQNDPCPRVLIGDSRTARLDPAFVSQITGEQWVSLTAGAAKLNEIVDLYWLVADRVELRQVAIGLNFNMFNEYSYADRVAGVRSILENPLLYIFDRSVASTSFLLLRSSLTGSARQSGQPSMGPDEFWQWNVDVKARHHYGKWAHPDDVLTQLKAMGDHARDNGIELTFIIVPHHLDFQTRVADFGLTEQKARFEAEVAPLTRTIDFDYPNEWTEDRRLFTDPIHMGPELARRVLEEVFVGPVRVGREISTTMDR